MASIALSRCRVLALCSHVPKVSLREISGLNGEGKDQAFRRLLDFRKLCISAKQRIRRDDRLAEFAEVGGQMASTYAPHRSLVGWPPTSCQRATFCFGPSAVFWRLLTPEIGLSEEPTSGG